MWLLRNYFRWRKLNFLWWNVARKRSYEIYFIITLWTFVVVVVVVMSSCILRYSCFCLRASRFPQVRHNDLKYNIILLIIWVFILFFNLFVYFHHLKNVIIRNNKLGTHEFSRTLYRAFINYLLRKVINNLGSRDGCITHLCPLWNVNTFIERKTPFLFEWLLNWKTFCKNVIRRWNKINIPSRYRVRNAVYMTIYLNRCRHSAILKPTTTLKG
jgi:hypothetical protein